jgi:2-octaprenyl-6-methoxyphenol hydroxylase
MVNNIIDHNQTSRQIDINSNNYDYDLVIVGGGIVGVTLAATLKNSDMKIAIIETDTKLVAASRRQAYALSLMTGRIYTGIGVWSEIQPQITTYQQISLSDGNYPKTVQFFPQDLAITGQPPKQKEGLGYVGEHHIMLSSLHKFLDDAENLTWLCPAKVIDIIYDQDFATITFNQAEQNINIKTRLVIAADGAKSPTRQQAGITTHGWKYWQSCIAMTIQTEKPHNNIAFERFWPSGPMGVLPLPGNRCQVVWTAPHAEAANLLKMDKQEFLAKLEYRTAGLLGKLELLGDRYLFPVQLMQSDRYTKNRLALIGDAAHGCHPVGGQGLNMGIRDAAALGEIIKTANQQGLDIGSTAVLEQYENWRKKENLVILAMTDFLDRMFSASWLPLVMLRRTGLWSLRNIPLLKSLALRVMTGLFGKPPEIAQS